MIFDLHSDIITCKRDTAVRKFIKDNRVALAVWGTYLTSKKAFEYARRAFGISLVAFEDVSFCEDFDELFCYKPIYCSLTWNYDNRLAGGAMEEGGLTADGVSAIKAFNRHAVTLDTAHLNRKSFYKAIEVADRVICSHTCLDGVNPHQRNLTDRQIKLIIEKNGLIGLTLVSEFLTKSTATVIDVIKHVEYFADKFGLDNLAIGSDFFGTRPIKKLKNYDSLTLIKEELQSKGFLPQDIERIFFTNANNFFWR